MPHVLSPADLAKKAQRLAKKQATEAAKLAAAADQQDPSSSSSSASGSRIGVSCAGNSAGILKRSWVDVGLGDEGEGAGDGAGAGGGAAVKEGEMRVKVATWNMLAQTLVRRELFPGSDCLKMKDRKDMLAKEISAYGADIICLQEEDRLLQIPLQPALDSPGSNHGYIQARGPGKKHGLAVVFDKRKFRVVGRGEKVVQYDIEEISLGGAGDEGESGLEGEGTEDEQARRRRGGTRQTKNIGLMVGLEFVDQPGKGLIVGTTHLFWHPQYAYERTRQALILIRSLLAYRESLGVSWPIIIAGDFNTQPKETVYRLVTSPSGGLGGEHEEEVGFSRAVHDSLAKVEEGIKGAREKSKGGEGLAETKNGHEETGEEEGEGEGGENDNEDDDEDDDKETNNAEPIPTDRPKGTRHCVPSDGLLTFSELQRWAQEILGDRGVRSAYADTNWVGREGERKGLSYAGRGGQGDVGGNEPGWTSFTPKWRLTLDYLFDVPPSSPNGPRVEPRRVLLPHATEDLEPGLPKKGVCASDHTLLSVEYAVLY